LFLKKSRQTPAGGGEKSFYPILHVASVLKDYQKDVAHKEVESLHELNLIDSSFAAVVEEADSFQAKLQDFGQSFSNIDQSAGRFSHVKADIAQTVEGAQQKIEELKAASALRKEKEELQAEYEKLRKKAKKSMKRKRAEVGENEVAEVVAQWTKIPVKRLAE